MRSALFLSIGRDVAALCKGCSEYIESQLAPQEIHRDEAVAPSTLTDTTLRYKFRSLPGSLPEIPQSVRDHVNNIHQMEGLLPGQFSLLVSALGGCEIAMVRSAPLSSDGGERN